MEILNSKFLLILAEMRLDNLQGIVTVTLKWAGKVLINSTQAVVYRL